MSKTNTYQNWIEEGYNLFAYESFEGIQVERLARNLNLNKSGFYHYFGDRDSFLEQLMKHHAIVAKRMAQKIEQVQKFVPDFLYVLLNHTTPVMVHMQLVRNRHHPELQNGFNEVNNIIDPFIIPSWADFIGLSGNHKLAHRYYEQVRDMFYSRITLQNMNYDYLHSLVQEAKGIVEEMIQEVS